MTKLTYTLETTPNDHQDTKVLEQCGFEQEWDHSPYYFTTDSKGEAFNQVELLDEEGYESDWVLTKKS